MREGYTTYNSGHSTFCGHVDADLTNMGRHCINSQTKAVMMFRCQNCGSEVYRQLQPGEDWAMTEITSEFALLASRAAIQIDRRMNGRDNSADAITELADLLHKYSILSRACMGFVEVTNQAISRTWENLKLSTIDDLSKELRHIAESLHSAVSLEVEERPELQDFCANLSLAATGYIRNATRIP